MTAYLCYFDISFARLDPKDDYAEGADSDGLSDLTKHIPILKFKIAICLNSEIGDCASERLYLFMAPTISPSLKS